MATIDRVKNKSLILYLGFLAFNLFFIMSLMKGSAYAFTSDEATEALEAKIIARELVKEKQSERKSVVSSLFREGKKNYEAKNYEIAIEFFERAIQIDPTNKAAKYQIELCKEALGREMPETVTGSLVKRGKDNFKKGQYSAAIADFEAALASNPNDAEAKMWLEKAKEAEGFYSKKAVAIQERKKLNIERGVAAREKDASEQAMMLDVDKGWLPPEKLPHREMEVEEIISPEELAEQEAKKQLEEKMASVIVPAISVTDADIRDLIRQLMEMTGVTIVLDERALAELTKEQPIRISLTTANPMPLMDILNIAFKTTELGYKVEPNYVWVSDKATVAKEELVTRTYRLKYGARKTRKVELIEFGTKK